MKLLINNVTVTTKTKTKLDVHVESLVCYTNSFRSQLLKIVLLVLLFISF